MGRLDASRLDLALTNNLTFSPFVLAPLWSLPFEVDMYLVLPLLYLVAIRRTGVAAVVGMWVAAVALAMLITPEVIYRAKVLQFVPCFMGGVAGYALSRSVRNPALPAWLWPVWIVALWAGYATLNPGREGWLPCLLLGLSIPLFKQVSLPAVTVSAQRVAQYSYSIYLAHIPLLWLCCVKLPLAAPLQWTLFAGAMVAVPMALFHGIEQPMIRLGTRCADSLIAVPRKAPVAVAEPALF